jgi:hypothetical protein
MNPRFDVCRKQNDRFIKWVGTAESLEDLEKLIRTDSTNASQDTKKHTVRRCFVLRHLAATQTDVAIAERHRLNPGMESCLPQPSTSLVVILERSVWVGRTPLARDATTN